MGMPEKTNHYIRQLFVLAHRRGMKVLGLSLTPWGDPRKDKNRWRGPVALDSKRDTQKVVDFVMGRLTPREALGVNVDKRGDPEAPLELPKDRLPLLAGARPPDRRNHEVAGLEPLDVAAHLHHLSHRFVSEDEKLGTGRRGAVDESADLAVGSADSDIEALDDDLVVVVDDRGGVLDDSDFLSTRSDCDCFHGCQMPGELQSAERRNTRRF